MRVKKWIVILMAALTACETLTYGFQKVDPSGIKPSGRPEEQLVKVEFITPEELKAKIAKSEPVAIVDLRGSNAFARSDQKIKGAVHAKVRRVVHRLRELPRDREVITYCACPADEAATIGARALMSGGFKRVRVLRGGWDAWIQAGGQLQPRLKTL